MIEIKYLISVFHDIRVHIKCSYKLEYEVFILENSTNAHLILNLFVYGSILTLLILEIQIIIICIFLR